MQFFFFDTETELAYDEATSPPLRGRQFALSCLGYDEQSECLVTGDEEGRIRVWEIKYMLDQLQDMCVFPKELRARIQAAKGQEVPLDERRKICHGASADAQGSGMVVVTKDCIRLRHKWTAHKDVIKSLQVVPEPNVIVSVGMDRRVHVWAINTGGNPIGTKLGTLLQGVGVNVSWKFGYEYERVARERESLEALHVKGLIDEVRELVVPVDISVPPPTPPARSLLMEGNQDRFSNSTSRPVTVPTIEDQTPQAALAQRSATSLSGLFPKGRTLPATGNRGSPSRISLARKQQLQAIDPLRAASLYPKHKGSITPFNRTQDIAARGVQDAINDAMQGLYDKEDHG